MAGAKGQQTTALARSPGMSLAVNSVGELQQLAELLYKGGLTPPGIDSPNKVAAVILAGAEVGLAPTQALGSIMLTNGRLSIYGDGALALARASGLLENIAEIVTGEGDARHGTCEVKRKGEAARTFTFSMGEAKQAGLIERAKGRGPWATYPDRMLIARARGFALRDVFPDVLRGLITYEEAQDIVHTEVKVLGTTVDGQPTPTPAAGVAAGPQIGVDYSRPAITPEPPAQPAVALLANSEPVVTNPPMITEDQQKRFAELNQLIMGGKSLTDPAERKAAWLEVLAKYGVTTIRQFTEARAAEVLEELGEAHDPFTHPRSTSSAA